MTTGIQETGRTAIERLRGIAPVAALLLAAAPLAAQPPDLDLICRPEHAVLDQRPERPADVRHHTPLATYYLFDNSQLFEVRVSLINISPERQRVAGEDDWASGLKVRVQRDGIELGPGEFRVEPARRLLQRLVYFKDGRPFAQSFRRQERSPGSEPILPYDDYRHEEEAVESVPREIATYEGVVAVLRLRAADGRGLPLGNYTLSIADEANRARCGRDQLVVMRAPQSPLDVVDAHMVRANAYLDEGELGAAAAEMARATELAPDVLQGWVYRSAIALQRNDLAGQAEAATRLEALLAKETGAEQKEFVGVVRDARSVARAAPELRRQAARGVEEP